jgi:hypothetical protein
MRRPYIFLGDLLRTIERLRIRDPSLAQLVLRMLSMEHLEAGPSATREGAYAPRLAGGRRTEPQPKVPEARPPPEAPRAPDQRTARSPGLRRISTAVSPTPPPWLPNVTAMPRPVGPTPPPAPVAPPLFPKRQTRGLLTAALASWDSGGTLDVPRIVEALAQLRTLRELPLENGATMRRGVQLLIDGGLGMAPFRSDVEQLQGAIATLLPPDRMRTYHFIGSPLRKCVAAGAGVLKPWRPPARATPVLLVSDLGIGAPEASEDRAGAAEWLEFAEAARDAECALVALVPYGPDRWPRALTRAIRIIHWDHRTSAAAVRRSVLRATRGMS